MLEFACTIFTHRFRVDRLLEDRLTPQQGWCYILGTRASNRFDQADTR